MLKQRHQVFITVFAAVDAAAVASACLIAFVARLSRSGEAWPLSLMEWVRGSLILFAIPVALLTMAAFRLYKPRRDRSIFGESWLVLRAGLVSVATVVVAMWATGSEQLFAPVDEPNGIVSAGPARFQVGVLAVVLPAVVGAHRVLLRLVLRELRRRGLNMRHVAVVGVGRLGQITAHTLGRNAWTGIGVSYFINHHERSTRSVCVGFPVRGDIRSIDETLEAFPVDAVYVAIPGAMGAEVAGLLRKLERHAVDVRVVPDVHPRFLPQHMAVSELEGMPILSYRESPLAGVGGVLKRAMDILGAMLALVVFSPVMVVIALLIRRSGPGPIIFRQTRVSLGGEVFQIYKFRTMHEAACEEGSRSWTERSDPRVTPLGAWLRKTSLDELPQLFNVLRGEMALVGPRPERPELIDRFRDDWRGYMLRQQVKAGMTGWAQINGYRGNTSLRKRLQYDLFYIRNWSIALDVRILFATLYRGFLNQNAH